MTLLRQIIWQVYAPIYDSLLLLKPYTVYLHDCARLIDIRNDELLLDVGCGTGNLLLVIHKGRVVGMDSSSLMLFLAKVKYRILRRLTPATPPACFLQCDAGRGLSIPDNRIDFVVSLSAIHSFPHPQQSVADMVRVLKPGGKLLLTVPLPTTTGSIIKEHLRTAGVLRLLLSIIGSPLLLIALIINVIQEKWSTDGVYRFMTRQQVEEIARRSGLKILEARPCFSGTYTLLLGQKI